MSGVASVGMTAISRLAFGVVGWLALSACPGFASANDSRDGDVRIVGSWRGSVILTEQPSWDGSDRIRIAPTRQGGEVYVPYDLTDAWRELEHALPPNYATLAGNASKGGECLAGVGERVILLHYDLSDYIDDVWLKPARSEFRYFISQLVDLSPADVGSHERYAFEKKLRRHIAADVLCRFYHWKGTTTFPPFERILLGWRDHAKSIRMK